MPADIACISLEQFATATVRLSYGPAELVPLLLRNIAAAWFLRFERHQSLEVHDARQAARLSALTDGLVSHKFVLGGNPWPIQPDSGALAQSRWMVATILQTMSTAGWRAVAAPMLGKSDVRCDNFLFVRSGVPNPSPVVSVGLKLDDALLVTGTSAATNRLAAGIVRQSILSHWARGIDQERKVLNDGTLRFQLKGLPWRMAGKDAVDARLLIKRIVEDLAAAGYELIACDGIEPWDFRGNMSYLDTMFFQCGQSPPSYEEAVGEPDRSGGMAGSPQPLAPFQQPAIDMSDLTLLALHNADCMFLISAQEWTLSSVVLQMIQATWPAGLAEERDVPDSAVAARLFKLRGDPFLCTGEASATAKRLVLTIMARFANYGLRYVNDVRPMSATLTGMPTLLFGDAPPARRAPHFGLALGGNNKVRLIAPCQDDPNTLTEQAMQEAQSAIGGVLEDIAGQACSVALIAGEPEWTLLPGSFDLQSNDSDSMRRTRLLVGMVMARLAPLGWTMVGTPSLSGSRQQSDVVVFARFE